MLWPVICQGRTISQEALEWLRGWIGAHMDWSRKRLARELCVLWDWRNGMGRLKDFAARSFLLKLAERELIELPPVREYKKSGPQTVGWVKADFEHTPEPLCAELEQVRPVQLDWVEAGSDPARRVAFYLDRYHYLGWHVVGWGKTSGIWHVIAQGGIWLCCSLGLRLGAARRAIGTWNGANRSV